MRQHVDLRLWAVLFLVISVIAAMFGFLLIVGIVAVIARILFLVFAVLFVTFWVRHYRRRHR